MQALFKINIDSSGTRKLLNSVFINADNMPVILGDITRPELMEANVEAFNSQVSPYGDIWTQSELATKEGRKTLIPNEPKLYPDVQDISNYYLEGNLLLEKTEVNNKGFYYGSFHNDGKWLFAGLGDKRLDGIQDKIIDFILTGKYKK